MTRNENIKYMFLRLNDLLGVDYDICNVPHYGGRVIVETENRGVAPFGWYRREPKVFEAYLQGLLIGIELTK